MGHECLVRLHSLTDAGEGRVVKRDIARNGFAEDPNYVITWTSD